MIVRVTVANGSGRKRTRYEYLETYFDPADYPQAIGTLDQMVAGPFCTNCGRPESMHGRDERRRPDTCSPPYPLTPRSSVFIDRRPDAVLL